jgi:carbohydrate kinase (thermoresistant glucokinase family)
MPPKVVVMGVSGCGKSTVGAVLAQALGARFLDGDDLHAPDCVAKMALGQPLTDADRWPWLARVAQALRSTDGGLVVACSALRRAYRDALRAGGPPGLRFVHLAGEREVVAARLAARGGHFMPPALLDSQFRALEAPLDEPDVASISIDAPIERIVQRAFQMLRHTEQAQRHCGSERPRS